MEKAFAEALEANRQRLATQREAIKRQAALRGEGQIKRDRIGLF